MLVVVVPVRLLVALLLVFVEELLAEVLAAAEEVALIEMVASVIVAFVCLGPTIKREPVNI